MPLPPLRAQAQEEPHTRDAAPDYEQRFQDVRRDVRNVCDRLAGRHADVVRAPLCEPGNQQRPERRKPREGGDERDERWHGERPAAGACAGGHGKCGGRAC